MRSVRRVSPGCITSPCFPQRGSVEPDAVRMQVRRYLPSRSGGVLRSGRWGAHRTARTGGDECRSCRRPPRHAGARKARAARAATHVGDAGRRAWNAARVRLDERAGHYESYFQRANHPTRPLAFWIRYTALLPRAHPESGFGELWAVFFDGERGRNVAVKERFPIASCAFDRADLSLRIAAAQLD